MACVLERSSKYIEYSCGVSPGALAIALRRRPGIGWGISSIDRDGADESDLVHGIFANLLFEASVGL